MEFIVLTIFPEMFEAFWNYGIIKRALSQKRIFASAMNIRDYAGGKHRVTDDRPFGGGNGMVMKPEPLAAAIQAAKKKIPRATTLLMTPQGRVFNQDIALELAAKEAVILICGRYEGVDERISSEFIDDELSIGDYILTGGEPGAMVVMDAVTRLIPGVLGGEDSAEKESFSNGLLEHAHYTRPRSFAGMEVPEILLDGNHARIDSWRLENSLIRTFLKRKDLLETRVLTDREIDILKTWCRDIERIIRTQSLRGAGTLSRSEQER